MNTYAVYTRQGNLFCKYRLEDGGIILEGKNGDISFQELAATLSTDRRPGAVREKKTVSYGKTKRTK